MVKVYRKRKKQWQARVWFQGRQYSRQGNSKAEALEAGLSLFDELRRSGPKDQRPVPTFFEYCVHDYKPDAKVTLADATYQNRIYKITTLIEHFGPIRLDKITDDDVRAFRRKRLVLGIKPGTINDEEKVLKVILNHAKERNEFPAYAAGMPLLKVPKTIGHARAWTTEEIEKLFAAVQVHANDLLPLIVFGLNTGCRKTEIIRLRWVSVHWDTGQISIEPSEEWRPKSNTARTVPLGPALRPWLERLRDESETRETEKRSEFVFTGPHLKQPLKFWPQNRFDRARKAAGLKGGPHTMRHTYASHYLANGGTMFELANLMGHTDQRVTALYTHMLKGALDAAGLRVAISPPGIDPATAIPDALKKGPKR